MYRFVHILENGIHGRFPLALQTLWPWRQIYDIRALSRGAAHLVALYSASSRDNEIVMVFGTGSGYEKR